MHAKAITSHIIYLCQIQLIETLQLTSITDRLWRVQPCSAVLNEGIDVSL